MIALDTNILAYAVTASDQVGRHETTLALLEQLANAGAIVPLPVFGEFFNACHKKRLANAELARNRVELWLDVFDCPPAISEDYVLASGLALKHKLQYFDALIITVASRAGSTALLTEDMHDGLEVAGLKIINPFLAANETLLADLIDSAL